MGTFGGLYVSGYLWWSVCEWVSLVVYMRVGVFGGLYVSGCLWWSVCEWVSLVVYM